MLLTTNGFDGLRDIGNSYAKRLAYGRTQSTLAHHADLTHSFVPSTKYSVYRRRATEQPADLLGGLLAARYRPSKH